MWWREEVEVHFGYYPGIESRPFGNVKELMTREYWIASRGSHGLICIPHFSIHEVTTLDERPKESRVVASSAYARADLERFRSDRSIHVQLAYFSFFFFFL